MRFSCALMLDCDLAVIIQTLEQQRWLPKLLCCDYIIEYKYGSDNIVPGALLHDSLCFTILLLSYSLNQALVMVGSFSGPVI